MACLYNNVGTPFFDFTRRIMAISSARCRKMCIEDEKGSSDES
jgi:hypothetical protein